MRLATLVSIFVNKKKNLSWKGTYRSLSMAPLIYRVRDREKKISKTGIK